MGVVGGRRQSGVGVRQCVQTGTSATLIDRCFGALLAGSVRSSYQEGSGSALEHLAALQYPRISGRFRAAGNRGE